MDNRINQIQLVKMTNAVDREKHVLGRLVLGESIDLPDNAYIVGLIYNNKGEVCEYIFQSTAYQELITKFNSNMLNPAIELVKISEKYKKINKRKFDYLKLIRNLKNIGSKIVINLNVETVATIIGVAIVKIDMKEVVVYMVKGSLRTFAVTEEPSVFNNGFKYLK